jgi:hypothetical protein
MRVRFYVIRDTSGFGNPFGIGSTHDLDGDGKPDLAVANNNPTYITCFRNTTTAVGGTISFSAKSSYYGGYSPNLIYISDIDNNGKPDIVVGSDGKGQSIVFADE